MRWRSIWGAVFCLGGFFGRFAEIVGAEIFIAFSCKRRGLCPSCGARRMEDETEHLMTRVLPEDLPLRQWVLSLPFTIRPRVAYNGKVFASIVRIFMDEVSKFIRKKIGDR